jgi:hypothetical protein
VARDSRCSSCTKVRAATRLPCYRNARLCGEFDPTLIDHVEERRLEKLSELQKKILAAHYRLTVEVRGAPLPANSDEFVGWFERAHRKLLSDALPHIAGRFRRRGELGFLVESISIDAEELPLSRSALGSKGCTRMSLASVLTERSRTA